jgi:putative protease
MKSIELLAPAGDMTKLEIALLYGADAVYVGGKSFGLRAKSGNFTDTQLKQAVEYVHARGKKIYVTVNIFARNYDFEPLKKYLNFLDQIRPDAIIVSDLGVLRIAREITTLPIHISTQANVLNKYTAETYVELGASRIILARECSLPEIREIANHLKGRCEIETFIHGAMCVSYSGRCLLSSYMLDQTRDANRGACVQSCRFKYKLVEEKRPNEHYEIEQDANGSYILNSRDLCLADHLSDLAAAGVTSFKIEGRTKSEYYVAGVVNTYRKLMDKQKIDHHLELAKISHRPYTTGFLFASAEQYYPSASPHASHEFVALALGDGTIQQRNAFNVGDTLEILSPNPETFNKTFTVTRITNSKGENITRAKAVQEILTIDCPFELKWGDVLRIVMKNTH